MVTNKQVLLIMITLIVIIKISFIFPTFLSEVLRQDDSAAMAELAGVLNPRPPDWSSSPTNSSNYCHWQRVTCDGSGGVTRMDLDSMNLTGSLPRLFPPLPLLGSLSLSNNKLSGPMPCLHNLTSLRSLSLEVNSFTTITMEFFEGLAPTLEYLYISFNPALAPWSIPVQLARLVNLKEFTALDINLSGTLPDIFQSFPLDYLHLDGNNLVGSLPPSMARSKLSRLMLHDQATGLSGSIEVLSRIPFLRLANLGSNKFTGPIPDFSDCKALEFLDLGNNELTGVVPRSLESLASLSTLDLSNNRLQGPFPSFLLKKQVVLDNNTFCTTTGNPCDSQVTILLQIAAELGYPLKLSESWTGNDACGNKWPFVRCNSQKQIVVIDLHNQSFNGTISPALAELKMLQNVHLNDNNLTGSIPHSLTGLQHLRVIDVSNNGLSGKVPPFRTFVLLNVTGNPALLRSEGSSKPTGKQSEKRRRMKLVVTLLVAFMSSITAGICICFIIIVIARLKDHEHHNGILEKGEVHLKLHDIVFVGRNKQWIIAQEIQSFKFQRLAAATNNFDLKRNKIGEGGFGPVYKGELQDGKEIAVKRLSNRSGQGTGEFVNEVKVISKVQHKNLVKLLGFCVSKEERMLVYEYMPNMSLDAYLFDPEKRGVLDWRKRFNIIQGIGLGLLYLHRDSRPRIIHRDLKASNVLLDEDWNPKISDFGMARIFGTDEDQANTRRIVGTFGYMPREYAMEGRFSEKSDVFSFGVLVLEIISGRRNTSFHLDDDSLNLLEHAWKLWNRGEILPLIDPTICDPGFHEEILRCTHVGLLCVQDFVKDRPSMSLVISMLGSELQNLPTPNPPMFLAPEALLEHYKRSLKQSCSINNVTVSEVGPR